MFAVAGVSGRTGAATADALLRQGEKVRALVHNEAQGEKWLKRRAEVVVVDLYDAAALQKALQGVNGAYLLLPPALTAPDELEAKAAVLTSIVAGLKHSGLKTLVFLSAVGAQHAAGTGPIVALHRAEKVLAGIVPSVTFLRPAPFLENWATFLVDAIDSGTIPSFGSAHHKHPQTCAHDVGEAAAKALVESAKGTRFIELGGKENVSADDVAVALQALLGQPIKAVEQPVENAKAVLEKAGLAPAAATLHAEAYQGMARGLFHFGRPNQILRGSTTVYEALKPLV